MCNKVHANITSTLCQTLDMVDLETKFWGGGKLSHLSNF